MSKIKQKMNNKGVSLPIVILTVAFVGILVAIILLIVLLNFKMKATDQTSQSDFYTAETALDEIKAGLASDASDAMTDSYIVVMQQYSALDQTKRDNLFNTNYSALLRTKLKAAGSTATNYLYDVDVLKSYVTASRLYADSTGTGIKVEPEEGKTATMALTDKGVILKNLVVSYYNKNNYESRVKTDILIAYPNLDFTQTANTPNLLEYALVADNSLTTAAGNQSTITGSVYGGRNGVKLASNSNLSVKNGKVFMTNSDINLDAAASLTTDSSAGLWARNLKITSGTVNLSGSTYVANDLLVSGNTASSNVTLSGVYNGFGNPATAKISNYIQSTSGQIADVTNNPANYSSAVIVNGTEATLNFAGLTRLMLAGDSYVGVTLQNTELTNKSLTTNDADIQMGESVTVKSNQIGYLVPDSYVGVGYADGGQNPLTAAQYNKLAAEVGTSGSFVDVSALQAKYAGITGYKTAFYPYGGSSIVYFYLTFSNEDAAATYFQQYYKVNADKVANYLTFYTNGISYGNSTTLNLCGNAMVYDGNSSVSMINSNNSEDTEVLKKRQSGMQDMFGALGIKLITSYTNLTNTEKTTNDVFQNLVFSDKMTGGTSSVYTLNSGKDYCYFETEKTNYRGILANAGNITIVSGDNGTNNSESVKAADVNNSKSDLTVYVGNENSSSSKKIRVIVTTGNVKISQGCSFNGLIIAGGSVEIDGGATLTANANDVAKVLQSTYSASNSIRMMDYLKDAESYVLSGASAGTVTTTEGSIDTTSLIVFRHWKKE